MGSFDVDVRVTGSLLEEKSLAILATEFVVEIVGEGAKVI